jgi:hypothetical protein
MSVEQPYLGHCKRMAHGLLEGFYVDVADDVDGIVVVIKPP